MEVFGLLTAVSTFLFEMSMPIMSYTMIVNRSRIFRGQPFISSTSRLKCMALAECVIHPKEITSTFSA